MSKRLIVVVLAGMVGLAGLAPAQDPGGSDEPPVRLKKKKPRGDEKPMTEPAKPDEKKKADDKKDQPKAEPRQAEPVTQQEEDKEVLQRVIKNAHSVDDRLAKNDLGEATRQTQRDILNDIESLIHRAENPPQSGGQQQQNQGAGGDGEDNRDQQGGGGEQGSKDQQGSAGQKGQGQPGSNASGQKSQGNGNGNGKSGSRNGKSRPGGSGQKSGTQPGSGPGGKQPGGPKAGSGKPGSEKPDGKAGSGKDGGGEKPGGRNGKNGNGGGGGDRDDPVRNRNADLYKDVWGHLPETLRAQMDAYSNPQPFLPKYDELIKQYYSTIAEKGRRKGE